ncbi:MAG: LysM peptidoglycan-binding domain-containing protein, partial [Rhodoferax sp.]
MADSITSPLNGIRFDTSKLADIQTPLGLAQQSVSTTPQVMPVTKTPLSDPVAAGAAGVEKGAETVSHLPGAGVVGNIAGRLGFKNDVTAVGQHLMANRFADAAVEAGGVVGQAGGATVGAYVADIAITRLPSLAPGGALLTTGLAATGAYFGSEGGKKLAIDAVNQLDTTASLAPGQTVTHLATLPDGTKYGVGLTVDGRLDWYRIDTPDWASDGLRTPNNYSSVPVAVRNQLTDSFAKATLSTEDVGTYNRYVSEIKAHGDITENITARIQPIGTVAIDESQKTPLTSTQVTHNITNGLSPNGKEPLGQQISDGPGKSHSWQLQDDGSVVRVAQENFTGGGTRVTVTTYGEGESAPSQERQTVSGPAGIVSDALLKPDSTGALVVDKLQVGGVLETPATTGHTFTPLPNSGTADNSYTIKPGDSLWKIGKSLGLSDGETMRFIADTEASTRAVGSNANVNDLKPGNTLALPDWVQDKLHKGADTSGTTDGSDAHFNHYPPIETTTSGEDTTAGTDETATTDAATQQILDVFGKPPVISRDNDVQLADAGTGTVSDAGPGISVPTGNGSTSNQPPALADTGTVAPDSVATGPDGSDNRFTRYPVPPPNLAPLTDG